MPNSTSNNNGSNMHFEHLVYVRVTEGCNLRCDHCFIPPRPAAIQAAHFARIPQQLAPHIAAGARVRLQWHGGEPTLFGPQVLERAIAAVEQANAGRYTLVHGIQTNLINYAHRRRAWAALYHRYFQGEVGVSWDPGIRRHGSMRQLRAQPEEAAARYQQRFEQALAMVVADGLAPDLVITTTRPFFRWARDPFRLFAQLQNWGVGRAHLERLTPTGEARRNWRRLGVTHLEYSTAMSRIARAYRVWLQHHRTPRISTFDGLAAAVRTTATAQPEGFGCWSGRCDRHFHTISHSGYHCGCTALSAPRPSLRVDDILSQRRTRREAAPAPCGDCRWRRICSGGCLELPAVMDGSGECSGARMLLDTMAVLFPPANADAHPR